MRAGFLAGDILRKTAGTPGSILPGSQRISAQRTIDMAPAVRRSGLDGGLLAYDGQLIDDARLVAAVARTAAQHGARILTYTSASEATGTSLRLTDQRTGESFDMSAGAVINASGVWAGEIDPSLTLRPSRGTHLVFGAKSLGNPTAALTIPIPGELNRFVFAMPEQLGRVYLGLTDEEAPGPIPDVPQPTSGEVKFLLDVVNTALDITLDSADVIGSYAGLRPLIDTGTGRTADVSRDHVVVGRFHRQTLRHLSEQLIAFEVAVGVVDELEAVEVDDVQREVALIRRQLEDCMQLVANLGAKTVTAGVVPASSPVSVALAPGTYYWHASYSGDQVNDPSASTCGSEVLTVTPPATTGGTGTSTGTSVTVNTESTYDWTARQWTVPINLLASQVLKIGRQPLSLTLGGREYAVRPNGGADWGIRFAVTFLFPA